MLIFLEVTSCDLNIGCYGKYLLYKVKLIYTCFLILAYRVTNGYQYQIDD